MYYSNTFVCVQLVADAKLLYDLDVGSIGQRLLEIKDCVVIETSRRHKQHGEILEDFQKRMEESLSQQVQDGIHHHILQA